MRAILTSHPAKPHYSPHSLAAISIQAYARSKGVEVDLLSISWDPDEAARQILDSRADIIGFTANYATEPAIRQTIGNIRDDADKLIVVGGPSPTYANQRSPIWSLGADWYVRGDGEAAFSSIVELAGADRMFEIPSIKGVMPTFRDEFATVDLASLPSPYPVSFESSHLYWETSRNCAFRCSYCAHPGQRSGFREHALERIDQEILIFRESDGLDALYITDPVLGGSKPNTKEVLRRLPQLDGIHLNASLRPEYLDNEMLDLISAARIGWLDFGLQTTNSDLSGFRKNDYSCLDKLRRLSDAGAPFNIDLIAGIPGDSPAMLRESMRVVIDELRPTTVRIHRLCVYDGTSLHREAESKGWSFDPRTREIWTSDFGPKETLDDIMEFVTPVSQVYRYLRQRNEYPTLDQLERVVRALGKSRSSEARQVLGMDPLQFDAAILSRALEDI